MKLRLVEQACTCSTMDGGGGLEVRARLCHEHLDDARVLGHGGKHSPTARVLAAETSTHHKSPPPPCIVEQEWRRRVAVAMGERGPLA